MPPVLGPFSPSNARLWSCAATSGQRVGAVDERKEARLLADEAFLDDDLGARRAERARRSTGSIAAAAASRVSATVTPLPAAKPSALTTIGRGCRAR